MSLSTLDKKFKQTYQRIIFKNTQTYVCVAQFVYKFE